MVFTLPGVFFVVENKKNREIQAFTIVVAVTEDTYRLLKSGEISDLYDFSYEEVTKDLGALYRFVADICVSRMGTNKHYMGVAVTLLSGLFSYLAKTGAEFILTSPISDDGNRVCTQMGFQHLAQKEVDGTIYPILELVVTERMRKRYAKISSNKPME